VAEITSLYQITTRTSHLRGQFKSRARLVVAAVYGFDTSMDAEAIEHNRALFVELKWDSAFIFRVRASLFSVYCPCSQMREEPWQNAR
jgi:hypothetical protein